MSSEGITLFPVEGIRPHPKEAGVNSLALARLHVSLHNYFGNAKIVNCTIIASGTVEPS